MKSAMTQLLEWHRLSMRSYSETNKMIEALLEKEKNNKTARHLLFCNLFKRKKGRRNF
jgi:hypothetical protein